MVMIIAASALGLSSIVLITTIIVFRKMTTLQRQVRQLTNVTQRLDRDVSQQRYALAMLRQLQHTKHDVVDETENGAVLQSDEEAMAAALQHLDLAGLNLSNKPEDLDAAMMANVQAEPESVADKPKATAAKAMNSLNEGDILQFIKKAVKNNQVGIAMQPIVKLPERQIVYNEVFSRILVGDQGYIPAHKFISVARDHNLINAVDNLLLMRCLQMVKQTAKNEAAAGYFVNITAQTMGNKTYVSDLTDFLAANPKLSSRLIFEITQSDSLKLSGAAKNVMEALALLGCRFSMDQVTMFGMDIERLVDQSITFVKMDARALVKESADIDGKKRLKKMKDLLDGNGVQVIVEKVENDRQLLNIIDLHVDYGQGYYFGEPALVV